MRRTARNGVVVRAEKWQHWRDESVVVASSSESRRRSVVSVTVLGEQRGGHSSEECS